MAPSGEERPEVAANFALTWDGRISTRNHTRSDFSSKRDKHRLLEIRASGDAVMVGRGTLEAENMEMGLPDEALRSERMARGHAPYPLRVIVSNSGRIDPNLRVFQSPISPIVIFSTRLMPNPEEMLHKARLHLAYADKIDLKETLGVLYRTYGVRRLICEGGALLMESLIREHLVDEINVTFCPRVFGGETAPTITAGPGPFLSASQEFTIESMETAGDECFVKYRLKRPN